MRVLHINQSDIGGGAAIAGYRLHQGLRNQGVDSKLLVDNLQTNDENVERILTGHKLERQLYPITSRIGLNYINIITTFNIKKHPFYEDADILNFHNLHGGYFNYLFIPYITSYKPAVFTLHDMWSFTGHCAYSFDCERWKVGCGKCPYPETYPAIKFDNSKLEWKFKKWVYNQSRLVIVAPSLWLTKQARASMLNQFHIHHIPYGIDTNNYQPRKSELCKVQLGIPLNKKVLLFAAANLKDPRKGSDLLFASLELVPNNLKPEIVLLTFGDNKETISKLGMQTISLGYTTDDKLKSTAFSAADIFVFPSRADNLPLVLQESLACGTPIVAFDVGGVSDLVRPNITGYLARPENTIDLANGIISILQNTILRDRMSKNCREIALNEYSLELQSKRYIKIYQDLIEINKH